MLFRSSVAFSFVFPSFFHVLSVWALVCIAPPVRLGTGLYRPAGPLRFPSFFLRFPCFMRLGTGPPVRLGTGLPVRSVFLRFSMF